MSWIEVHDNLREHFKTYALAEALNIEQYAAVGLVVSLWTWAVDHAQDGDLGKYPLAAIASACMWRKKPEVLLAALQESGFITHDLMIHDWECYAGKLIEQREIQREQSRARQQKRRDKISDTSRVSHAQVTRDVTDDSRVNNEVTVPNRTIPISIMAASPPITRNQSRKLDPPSLEEVKAYCRERNNNVNPSAFLAHYEANGWVQGKGKPIKDWKAAVRVWENNNFSPAQEPEKQPTAIIL
jgi:hypothetical protein